MKESDNNVKLIVLDRLETLRQRHEHVLDALVMDILRVREVGVIVAVGGVLDVSSYLCGVSPDMLRLEGRVNQRRLIVAPGPLYSGRLRVGCWVFIVERGWF